MNIIIDIVLVTAKAKIAVGPTTSANIAGRVGVVRLFAISYLGDFPRGGTIRPIVTTAGSVLVAVVHVGRLGHVN